MNCQNAIVFLNDKAGRLHIIYAYLSY